MSYKVDQIHQIESLANKCGCNNYPYFSGFEYKGEYYTLGWVTLSEEGQKKLKAKTNRAEIRQHWIMPDMSGKEIHVYGINRYTQIRNYCNWRQTFVYDVNLDDYIEDAGPIDYKNMSITELCNMPQDQFAFHLQMKSIADGTYDPNPKATPLFKDWEIPELMLGWVAFIAFFFIVFIVVI